MNKGTNQSHLAASRATDCSQQPLLFADLGSRQVVAEFTAGDLSSDCGVLLLRPVDHGLGLARTLNRLELSNHQSTRCHKLAHDPAVVEHCLLTMGAREVVLDLDAA